MLEKLFKAMKIVPPTSIFNNGLIVNCQFPQKKKPLKSFFEVTFHSLPLSKIIENYARNYRYR
jgi:hypothetical protein